MPLTMAEFDTLSYLEQFDRVTYGNEDDGEDEKNYTCGCKTWYVASLPCLPCSWPFIFCLTQQNKAADVLPLLPKLLWDRGFLPQRCLLQVFRGALK